MSAPCPVTDHEARPCTYGGEHVHCGQCAMALPINGERALCSHHAAAFDEWAVENRYWCEGLHRNQWGARLPAADREPVPHEYFGDAA